MYNMSNQGLLGGLLNTIPNALFVKDIDGALLIQTGYHVQEKKMD